MRGALDDPLAQPLLIELAAEYAQRYGGTLQVHRTWLRGDPADFAAPDGGLLIGVRFTGEISAELVRLT